MQRSFTDHIILLLATGFYSGKAPVAPGTFGSIAALIPFFWLQHLNSTAYVAIVVMASAIGVYICERADQLLNTHDNKAIVWDEFCGVWIALFMAPPGYLSIVIGFLLFRLFDILKPWPISLADKRLEGGLGVMLDDLIAGFFAFIVLQLLYFFALIPVL